jgi:hypothetical protein
MYTCEVGTPVLDQKLHDIHEIYMKAYFVKRTSTLANGGQGLFLQQHLKLMDGFLLPYTGTIVRRPLTRDEILFERAYRIEAGLFIIAAESDLVSYMNMANEESSNQVGFCQNGCIKLLESKRATSKGKLLECLINYGGPSYEVWKRNEARCADTPRPRTNNKRLQSSPSGHDLPSSITPVVQPKYFCFDGTGERIVNELERLGVASFELPGFDEHVRAAIAPYPVVDKLCDDVVRTRKDHKSLLTITFTQGLRKYFYYETMFKQSQQRPLEHSIQALQRLIDGPLHDACHELMHIIDRTVADKVGLPVEGHTMLWSTVGVISLPGASDQTFHGDVAPQVNFVDKFATAQSTLSVLGN